MNGEMKKRSPRFVKRPLPLRPDSASLTRQFA
jgi:hypothetical protein